jgi:hypothetical protein
MKLEHLVSLLVVGLVVLVACESDYMRGYQAALADVEGITGPGGSCCKERDGLIDCWAALGYRNAVLKRSGFSSGRYCEVCFSDEGFENCYGCVADLTIPDYGEVLTIAHDDDTRTECRRVDGLPAQQEARELYPVYGVTIPGGVMCMDDEGALGECGEDPDAD